MNVPAPRVSVLLAAHNAAATLPAAIASVLGQTLREWELVLVDDGSTDGTAAVLAAQTDPRVRIVSLPENIGLTRALNAGLPLCRAPYIARLDADDTAHPARLAAQADLLDRRPEVVLVGCAHEIRPAGGPGRAYVEPVTETAIRFGLLFDNTLHHPTVMLRRSVFDAGLTGYDPACRCAQDYALWAALWDRGHFAKLPEVLVTYGHGADRVSVRRAAEQREVARAVSLGLMARLLPGRALTPGDRDAAGVAWPACPVPATPESLRGAALVLDLFRAFLRQPRIDRREARRMRRAWALRVLNSLRVADLPDARRAGVLSRLVRDLPFTLAWYAGLRAAWVLRERLRGPRASSLSRPA